MKLETKEYWLWTFFQNDTLPEDKTKTNKILEPSKTKDLLLFLQKIVNWQ